MSRSIRYKHPVICEHLASQYVAGVMTPLVRARTETLISETPELEKTIASWASYFSTLQARLPDESVSAHLWDNIEKKITSLDQAQTINQPLPQTASWWHNLLFWRASGMVGMASSLVLAMLLLFLPAPAPIEMLVEAPTQAAASVVNTTPSYMAAMSRQVSDNAADDTILFVINAYKKTESAPSRLFVQWSERHPRKNQQVLHLWAEDIDTGELSYIGVEPTKGEPWSLTKTTWTAIANSRRLLMTANATTPTSDTILFSGPCVQLGDWQQGV